MAEWKHFCNTDNGHAGCWVAAGRETGVRCKAGPCSVQGLPLIMRGIYTEPLADNDPRRADFQNRALELEADYENDPYKMDRNGVVFRALKAGGIL